MSSVILTSVKMKRATEWHVMTALHSPRAWATSLGIRKTWISEVRKARGLRGALDFNVLHLAVAVKYQVKGLMFVGFSVRRIFHPP